MGDAVPGWTPRRPPEPTHLAGRWCALTALEDADRAALYDVLVREAPPSLWTYLGDGPFEDRRGFDDYLDFLRAHTWVMVVRRGDRPAGMACFWNTSTVNGSTEIGSVAWAPALQRTTAATEAVFLMADHVFGQGYRRLEWKCDSLNEPSRRAARRLGFGYEGRFRNAVVYKGRSRDTDWFAMTDADWVRLRPAYAAWLAPENHDEDGGQRSPLRLLNAGTVVPHDETSGRLS
ncbi:MAG: GNAT family N-acetyltransferase [Marmoricola sp.]